MFLLLSTVLLRRYLGWTASEKLLLGRLDGGGHTNDFLGPLDSTVEYLYSKFGEFSFLLLINSVEM